MLHFLWVSFSFITLSQDSTINNFKAQLAKATIDQEKVKALGNLSRILVNLNLAEADKWACSRFQQQQ